VDSTAKAATATTSATAPAPPEPELSVRHERMGPNPVVGFVLAVAVGVLVFWFLHRIRRAFGMK